MVSREEKWAEKFPNDNIKAVKLNFLFLFCKKLIDKLLGFNELFTSKEGEDSIQVFEKKGRRYLILNGGLQSINYDSSFKLTPTIFDAFLLTADILPPKVAFPRLLLLGLGGGYVARGYLNFYPHIFVDGVEINKTIISLGKQFFNLTHPHLNILNDDAQNFLRQSSRNYAVIIIDLYKGNQPVSFLSDQNFLLELRNHLSYPGVVSLNFKEFDQKAKATFLKIFREVLVLPLPSNLMVIATNFPIGPKTLHSRLKRVRNPKEKFLRDYVSSHLKYLK